AVHASDREAIRPGRIYIAPPDYHLLVHRSHIRVVRGPRENRNRPAIDPLFRTAARAYGNRVVGVILSGLLDDGSAGLATIKRHGQTALVAARHPCSPARSATACSGRYRSWAGPCDFVAALATPILAELCWRRRYIPTRAPCGKRCGRWKKVPIWRTAWPGLPAPLTICAVPSASSNRRRIRSSTPALCAPCC